MKFATLGLAVALLCVSAGAQVVTPNLGLTEPAIGAGNWGALLNADLTILDNMAGGNIPVPAMNINTLKLGTSKLVVNDPVTGKILSAQLEGTIPSALIPPPSATTLGGVESISCGATAINTIGINGVGSCAASATGGNGGINNQAPTNPTAGTGGYVAAYTFSVAGNLLSTVGGLRGNCGIFTTTSVGSLRISFGGQVLTGIAATQGSAGATELQFVVFNNGATNAQWGYVDVTSNGAWNRISFNNLSVDTTTTQTIECDISQLNSGTWEGTGWTLDRAQQ